MNIYTEKPSGFYFSTSFTKTINKLPAIIILSKTLLSNLHILTSKNSTAPSNSRKTVNPYPVTFSQIYYMLHQIPYRKNNSHANLTINDSQIYLVTKKVEYTKNKCQGFTKSIT